MKKKDQFCYTDHARKEVIRKHWCKEQIKILHSTLGKKLIYLGLPGIEGLDILEWIDYLEKVIVFQCSEYKNSKNKTEQFDFVHLTELLENLDKSEKIKTYALFRGFIEDIVIGGFDENGGVFDIKDFVTVYNLDFCNGLTTPRNTRDLKGNIISYFKIDVIKKLVQYQNELCEQCNGKHFIFYMTVHSNFLESNMDEIDSQEITLFRKKFKSVTKGKNTLAVRDLKAYTYFKLAEIFKENSFHFEFLPPIFYQGSEYPNREKGGKLENHWMLTFTILGTKNTTKNDVYQQDMKKYLEDKFVFASNTKFQLFNDAHFPFSENDYTPSAKELLINSYIFKNYWLPLNYDK